MKIQTFTIVAGTAVCNAKCPFCVSKMTGIKEVGFKEPNVNWRNFDKACRLAQISNVSTVLITGKGEPTLYPEQVTKFLERLKRFEFPFIEIQTNSIIFDGQYKKYKEYLEKWYQLGLNTISISIVDYRKEKNKEIYTPDSDYIDLKEIIKKLHELGFSIRLSCMMFKGAIDNPKEVEKLVDYAKENKVEQLTVRSIRIPKSSENKEIYNWTKKHALSQKKIEDINDFLERKGKRLMTLENGTRIYDFKGQNIATSDCLTIKPDTDDLRQLIFFPDGHLKYDWQYKGAVLM